MPPGLDVAERPFYATLARAGAFLLHPALAPYTGVPGPDRRGTRSRVEVIGVRAELVGTHRRLGQSSPSEAADRYRLGRVCPPAQTTT
jgi:hypothetical protein